MAWAWKNHLTPPRKLVLLSLADNADDSGICWPSIAYLSRRTHLSPRTVQRILRELEKLHLLTKKVRTGDFGRQTSNQYRLCLPCDSQRIKGEGVNLSPSPSSVTASTTKPRHREGDSGVALRDDITMSPLKPKQEPSLKTKKEPLEQNPPRNSHAKQRSPDEQKRIAYLLSQHDKKEAESLSLLLTHAASNGLIHGPESRWLKGVIRNRAKSSKYDN